ncbi:uroporphyrinogen-III C-methyltransferase [bacterium]|nr:uroporphyrinogen-III C-methyltransferase [bacterium]
MISNIERKSIVYLVGAGPGDPGLITRRGYALMRDADALVYDGLVDDELVRESHAPEKIYVGKTAGGHTLTQDEINDLLVDLATKDDGPRRIVRLKGGDPFVFGRGGEEALALADAGVPFEVVPGVTAGISAPAAAGIPVTHRKASAGVVLVTGNREDGRVRLPFRALVESGMTLSFYMGVASLSQITEELIAAGMESGTPAVVIQDGNLPSMRTVVGDVANIASLCDAAQVRPPSICVIGKVAALQHTLGAVIPRPLAGKTVMLARAEDLEYPEADGLRLRGARVIDLPVIRCVARAGDAKVDGLFAEVTSRDVVVFTSGVAAAMYLQFHRAHHGETVDDAKRPRFIATTPAIRRRILDLEPDREEGADDATLFRQVLCPAQPGAAAVLELLRELRVEKGATVWLPRSASAGDEYAQALRGAGYDAQPVALYDSVPQPIPADVRSRLLGGRVDAVLCMSGSAAESVVASVPELAEGDWPSILFAAIGQKTAAAMRRAGLRCDFVPDHPSRAEFFDAVVGPLTTGG